MSDFQQEDLADNQHTDSSLSGYQGEYHQTAQALHNSKNVSETEAVLAPLASLSEEEQISYLKFLAREENSDAADIATAMNTFSTVKTVRKEARRTLIRLESKEVYAEWEPPTGPTISQALELFNNPSPRSSLVADEADENGETDPIRTSSFLSELDSLLSNPGNPFFASSPEYVDVAVEFLEVWTEGEYAEIFETLASTSPLREGLSTEEWGARRQQWHNATSPKNLRIFFSEPVPSDKEQSDSVQVDITWSLELNDAQADYALPELPQATLVLPETGRRWFWSRYTLIEEDGEWFVQDISDEGTALLRLSTDEMQQRLAEIAEIADKRLEEDDFDDDDLFEDDDDEELEDEELEDEEDDDDEELDESFADILGKMDEAIRLATQGLYYYDALIALQPQSDPTIYQRAVQYATLVNDTQRAAAYLQQLAQHSPEYRGKALRDLALIYEQVSELYEEEEDEEQQQRFTELTETTLRDSISADQSPIGYMLLADFLIRQDRQMDEAEALLKRAQQSASEPQEIAGIEAGLAQIAQAKDDRDQALEHYLRVADLTPDFPHLWFQIGTLQRNLDKTSEAVISLQKSIESEPELIEAYIELSVIYNEQNAFNKAREILKQGLEENEDEPALHAALSITYTRASDVRSAQKHLQIAESLDDEDEFVKIARAMFDEKKGKQQANSRNKSQSKSRKPRKR